MRYRTYKLNCENIARTARKHKTVKFAKKDNAVTRIQKTLKWLYREQQGIIGTMECVIHAEEYQWLRGDKRVYFPVDLDMAESIMKGTYSVKDENAFYIKPECFILNLPEGLAFNGNSHGTGLMVTVSPHDERAETVYGEFMKWLDLPPVNVSVDGNRGNFTIMITYMEDPRSEMYMRVSVPSFNAVKILQMHSAEEYETYMSETNNFKFKAVSRLSKKELAYQYKVMRFVCGFLVYKKALPQRIISGLPAIHSKVASTPLTKNKSNYVVHSPTGEHEVAAGHYRSWHFRQLINERYYRGEHKKEAIGSRVIFVSDSFVSHDVTVKTIKGG
jgi:hypothetical protein